jgi:hypothetical protein
MKTPHRIAAPVLWASLAAFALAPAACGTNRGTASAQTSGSTTAVASPQTPTTQPMRLTGCLQEGNRGTYILTELNRPQQPDSSNRVVVAREKLSAAEEAYVLRSGQHADLAKLVGARVHVEGTLARPSDLLGRRGNGGTTTSVGAAGEVKAIESGRVIREKDLAAIDVTSLQKVANTCGSHAANAAPRSR